MSPLEIAFLVTMGVVVGYACYIMLRVFRDLLLDALGEQEQ